MFSRRARWNASVNQWTIARRARTDVLDLTASNPTRPGIEYPVAELGEIMARAARAPYDPDPLGLSSAREALAAELGCDRDDVVITASTSEAYSFLFKLLCDPGDALLTATPSYPLLEHLAELELIELRSFALDLHQRWELDPGRVRAALTDRTRALLVVSPNNPTGSYVTTSEQNALAGFGLPIISDQVFRDHPIHPSPAPSFLPRHVLTFALGGLSQGARLPHYKLGWVRVSGPSAARREVLGALARNAHTSLPVHRPGPTSLPDL